MTPCLDDAIADLLSCARICVCMDNGAVHTTAGDLINECTGKRWFRKWKKTHIDADGVEGGSSAPAGLVGHGARGTPTHEGAIKSTCNSVERRAKASLRWCTIMIRTPALLFSLSAIRDRG
eukprot:2129759-Pyramimonas_sp.AAC.1